MSSSLLVGDNDNGVANFMTANNELSISATLPASATASPTATAPISILTRNRQQTMPMPMPREGRKKQRMSRQQKRQRQETKQQGQETGSGKHKINDGRLTHPYPPFPKQNQRKRTLPRERPHPTWQGRVFDCIQQAASTKSIIVQGQQDELLQPQLWDQVRLITSSSTAVMSTGIDPLALPVDPRKSKIIPTVRVQPLLILDLNGIMCHRTRKYEELPGVRLRQPLLGRVAGTPVIARTDLAGFLRLLDQHFCLAVWTSAKPKTAKSLLRLLFPLEIRQRLLFVWAQDRCRCRATTNPSTTNKSSNDFTNHNDNNSATTGRTTNTTRPGTPLPRFNGDNVMYEKPLDQVWREYPLWNANNTLLIDDSPEKCPFAPENAVHPPPLHGQWRPPIIPPDAGVSTTNSHAVNLPNVHDDGSVTMSSNSPWIPDEHNEALQLEFFQRYIHHWQQQLDHQDQQPPHLEFLTKHTVPTPLQEEKKSLESRSDVKGQQQNGNNDNDGRTHPIVPVTEEMTNRALYDFLRRCGTGHMGWRGANST